MITIVWVLHKDGEIKHPEGFHFFDDIGMRSITDFLKKFMRSLWPACGDIQIKAILMGNSPLLRSWNNSSTEQNAFEISMKVHVNKHSFLSFSTRKLIVVAIVDQKNKSQCSLVTIAMECLKIILLFAQKKQYTKTFN